MSLTGLLEAIADDTQFRQVPSLASALATEVGRAGGEGADVTAPAALRPLLAATLAGAVTSAPSPPARPTSVASAEAKLGTCRNWGSSAMASSRPVRLMVSL